MKKQIRLIAFDLDGTLLDDQKRLSENNIQALTECVRQGIQIVPATGRPADGIPKELRSIPGLRYAITTNGGAVMDLETGERLSQCVLSNEQALHILDIVKEYHVMYDPYVQGRGITQSSFFNHMDEFGISPEVQMLVRATRDVVPDIYQYMVETRNCAEKINVFLADLSDRDILRERLASVSGLAISSSMYNNLEINAQGATKGNALLWLADYLGIPREETMAFGDGENDIAMLTAAGTGVAMGNASEQIRKAADEVTLTNDQDGVAAAIRAWVLK